MRVVEVGAGGTITSKRLSRVRQELHVVAERPGLVLLATAKRGVANPWAEQVAMLLGLGQVTVKGTGLFVGLDEYDFYEDAPEAVYDAVTLALRFAGQAPGRLDTDAFHPSR